MLPTFHWLDVLPLEATRLAVLGDYFVQRLERIENVWLVIRELYLGRKLVPLPHSCRVKTKRKGSVMMSHLYLCLAAP